MGKTKRFQDLNKGYVREHQAGAAVAWDEEVAHEPSGLGQLMGEGVDGANLIADVPPSTPATTNPFAQLLGADLPDAAPVQAREPESTPAPAAPKAAPAPAAEASAAEPAQPKKPGGLARVLAWLRAPE